MKKISRVALAATFAATMLSPMAVFAEGEENNDYNEPTYTLTYDFNGGATYDGKSVVVYENQASVAPALSWSTLVDCFDRNEELNECHPIDIKKGKDLDYVTVNDEPHYLGPDDGFMLNQDTVVKYIWKDLEMNDYDLRDDDGNEVSFEEAAGHTYHLEIQKLSFNMSDEEIAAIGIPKEEYEAGKAAIGNALENQGDLVAYFEIGIYEFAQNCTDPEGCRDYIHQGPFEVKIKYTEDMGDFRLFKLVYIDMDNNGNVTVGEAVDLTLVDGYLVGTIPHFSGYALIGTNNVPLAPDTGAAKGLTNAIVALPILSVVAILGIIGTAFSLRSIKK